MTFFEFKANNCVDLTPTIITNKQIFTNGPSPPMYPTEGASWQIRCLDGYRWLDNAQIKTMNCSWQGNWTIIPQACAGLK